MQTRTYGRLVALAAIVLSGELAWAQASGPHIDLTGIWQPRYHEDQPERIPGPALGDYTGLPITDGARRWAESWDPSRLTMPEHQCQVHIAPYIYRGPNNFRMWEEKDPKTQQVVAIKNFISTWEQTRTIWMDGRPHPSPNAAHTWMGFSTGVWEGDRLTVTTTHIKQGWIRRNGLPQSDKVSLTEHFIRHGNQLTHITIVRDPVYLTEPLVKNENFVLSPRDLPLQNWLWICEPVVEIAGRSATEVPAYLPGENPFLAEFRTQSGLPEIATRGGAETMYPEFMATLTSATGAPPAATPSRAAAEPPAAVRAPEPDADRVEVEIVPVRGNVYMLVGAGGNVTVQTGDDGVLVVDAQVGQMSARLLKAIARLSDKPIRYVVNTHMHADHIGGNGDIAKAGRTRAGSNLAGIVGDDPTARAAVIAHENVLKRIGAPTGKTPPVAEELWPTDTFFVERKDMLFNDEAVQLIHQPTAHTDGDLVVFFRRSDVIATGDVFLTTGYPVIDVANGGHVNGIINALNRIIDIAVPSNTEEGGTMIVPGHGRLCDEWEVVEYRDMVTIVRDRIQSMIAKGLSLAQVQAARPTHDYDARYGADSGAWTTAMFVETIYRNLSQPAPASGIRE